jgi:DNA-binding MarR family transcriptional regulator
MQSHTELLKAEYEALAAFRHALRRFAAFSAEAARGAGLTPQQHQALLAIKGAPGRETLTIGEIAAHLLIRPHSAVELVDRLADLGLIARQPDAADSRRVQVALTARSEALLRDLSVAHLRELQAIRPTLFALLGQVSPDVVPR